MLIKQLSRRASSTKTYTSSSSSSLGRFDSFARLGNEISCEDCGAYRNRRRGGGSTACTECASQITRDFFFDRRTVYRALRPDEDPSIGLFPRNEYAQFSLQEHVEYGASCHSQFISFSSSPEVAMFFAIQRALARDQWPCRIVQASLPVAGSEFLYQDENYVQQSAIQHQTIHCVMASVDESWSEAAQRKARLYDEICVESDIHSTFVERTFEIQKEEVDFFRSHLGHVGEFKVQYYKSDLKGRFEHPVDEIHVKIITRVIGLRQFQNNIQNLPPGDKKVGFQLRHEPEHVYDINAIAILALDNLELRLGYICGDHAPILVEHLPNLVAYQKLNRRDLTRTKADLPLTLHFRLPKAAANQVAVEIERSGRGKATLKPWTESMF